MLQTVNRRDVRMIQRSKDLGLSLESREPFFIPRELVRKHFDGHVAAELRIPSAIHVAHAAASELVEDLEVGESLPDHRCADRETISAWPESKACALVSLQAT